MATPGGNNEQVRYDILIEAKAAITAMRDMLKYTSDNTVKMAEFTNQVLADSKRWGVSWQQALLVYRQLNAELSKQKKATLFGKTGGQDIFGMSEKYLKSLDDAGRLQEKVKKGAKEMGDEVESSGKRGARGIDVMRIALGAIVSMILFRAIQAVEMFFRGAIEQARQFEDTLYRLRNVEESLSMQGIEISMKGLKEGITDIQKVLPVFSKEDVSQLVGTLAISTKQLGLNEQQILDLAKAIGILNIRSEKQEDLSTTAQHVLSSLLTGNAKGITALGIAFTENVMRAKAMELGFLEAGEALSTLTENEKGLTKLNIVLESTGGELANVGEYLDSDSAKVAQNAAAWKDLQTTVGQLILPLIPMLTDFFKLIQSGFNAGKVVIIEFLTAFGTLGVIMAGVLTGRIKDFATFTNTVKNSMSTLREALVNEFFKEMPDDAPEWFKSGWGSLIKEEAETATGPLQDLGDAIEEIDLSDFEQKIEDLLNDTMEARADLAASLDRKLEDLDTEYIRKAEDAYRDFLRKQEDINRDYENDVADLRRRHREEDENDEARYQLALWELRQKFLMDLEDALHARDARQVLRLQKQYAIDKEALRRKHELEEHEREQGQAAEAEELAQRRDERLAEARLEYERKLADQQIAKERERADLQLWYERELADLQLNMERKAQALIDAGIREKQITESNAAAVYAILQKYFGPGGLTDSLYQYMLAQFSQPIPMPMAPMSAPLPTGQPAPYWDLAAQSAGGIPTSTYGFAEGGTLLATRPTKAIFGEGGPERVDFTPLNRVGKNVGKVFGDVSGAGGGLDGTIRVMVDLSSDLEGRIVEQSMDGVASVLARVNRSK